MRRRLMTKNNEMIGHRVAGIGRFEPIAQLQCFASAAFAKWT
jgi:hypothetical protein